MEFGLAKTLVWVGEDACGGVLLKYKFGGISIIKFIL